MNTVSEKWKRMATELFQVFTTAMSESGYAVKEVVHPVYHPQNLQEMSKFGVKQGDIADMIIFSVKNWDQIRKQSNMKTLAPEPCFNQMLSHFKYPTLIYLMNSGFEKETQKEIKKLDDFKARADRMKLLS